MDPELFLGGEELNGKVFGILGFGKIGQAVAQERFGLKIIYYNRYKKDVDYFCNSGESVSLNELLETSDYLYSFTSY